MRAKRLIGAKIAIILGVLLLMASSLPNNNINNQTNFITGNMLVFGALSYMARRRQNEIPSMKWRVIEIISLIVILYFTFSGIASGSISIHPIPFFVAPIWIAVAYLLAFNNGKNIFRKKANGPKQEDLTTLEKLANLKEKKIITEEEFNSKKKQILDL